MDEKDWTWKILALKVHNKIGIRESCPSTIVPVFMAKV
jgi:hypothetical protein